jgi:acyl-CoA-binding protein
MEKPVPLHPTLLLRSSRGDLRAAAQGAVMSDLATQFQLAADASKSLPKKPDNDTLLKLYAWFKQATAGDVAGAQPGPFDFVGRAKYDAWAAVRGTTKDVAMRSYIDLVNSLKA